MNSQTPPNLQCLVVVRPEPPGHYTAEALGLPELRATCASREEAIHRVRLQLGHWFASGQLVSVELDTGNPFPPNFPWIDPNDPMEKEFLEELARNRREDLERTLQEYEAEEKACSNSSG